MVYFIIGFMVGAVLMLMVLAIVAMGKNNEPRNKVHFYVARDKNESLWLYLGKPIRGNTKFYSNPNKKVFCLIYCIEKFGLKYENYNYLKWEDEPLEVFINMED